MIICFDSYDSLGGSMGKRTVEDVSAYVEM